MNNKMMDTEKIERFLNNILTIQDDNELAECLKVWDAGSPEWEEIAMSLFESELLYPLSQVVEYLRSCRQIDDYIDHIELIKAPAMVKREEIFHTLCELRAENKEAVQRVLSAIYEKDDLWDTLDSAIKGNNLKAFEQSMGSDERSVNLKKIVCHHLSITQSYLPIYHIYESPRLVKGDNKTKQSSLEEQKLIAKEILSLCAKLMLSANEERYLKQICKNQIIENSLSFEPIRYYYRVRDKKAAIPKKVKEQTTKPQPQLQEYYTKQEVIKMLGVSNTTLYNWRDKELPCHKIGRKVYYLKSDIAKAMAKKKK